MVSNTVNVSKGEVLPSVMTYLPVKHLSFLSEVNV